MLASENTQFFCPVKINAGKKALDHLPFELDSLGAKNPFLITGLEATQRGLVKKVINAFKDSGMSLAVFDETGPVSSLQSVLKAAKLFRNTGCDAVVALGSNPVMSMAKALNILVSQETMELEAYSAGKSFEKPMKPFISVPCFSGDGQENGPHARVGKMTFSSTDLMPNLVIIDPALISSERPLKITTSAMRAMTCAMESYIAHPRNSLTEAFAHVAIQLVFMNLLKAVRREDRKKSQHALLMAETISECAFCNTTPGMAYTLGLEISKHCMVPRGLCMGILLPHVLDYISGADGSLVPDLLLPVGGRDLFAITAERLRSSKAVSMLRDFCYQVYQTGNGEIPGTLEDTGLSKEKLKAIARQVHEDSKGKFTYEGSLIVLEHAWSGSSME